jgi:PAS domain S-box-containing protein
MMKKRWTAMKNIIQASSRVGDLFLSLVNEKGVIICANAAMLKKLHLEHPRTIQTNFFDLVHPTHLPDFKNLFGSFSTKDNGIELYIKNGHYHLMKWHVNYLREEGGNEKTYLCLGYNLLDEERLKKFNNLVRQNYQLLIDNLSGIIFHDGKGDIVATNQKTAAIFHTSLERIYQLKDIRHLWDTQWTIFAENGNRMPFSDTPFMRALQTGKPQQATLQIRLANGEDKWVLFNSQPLPDKETEGNFSVVSSIIDVSNERKLSRKLEEKETLIHSFLKQTTQLAWVVDEEENLHFASSAFYDHFGINEKQCANNKITSVLPSAAVNAVYDLHKKVLKTGLPLQTTQQIRWADGSNLISYINLFPIGTISGKQLIGGQAVHLPDRSELEKELHQAHERFLNLSRTTSDAIWEWDMQSGQMVQNEVLLEMIGYQPDHLRGLSWWLRHIHPQDRNRIADRVKDMIEQRQQSWDDEYQFRCADGHYKHIRHKGYVVYENGLPVKMIGSLNDVSGLKKLENRLADEKVKLQKEISEAVIHAQEKERTQIGRELHDNVNQLLSATKLFVDVLVPHGKEQELVKRKSIEYIQLAIDEIRKVSKELVAPQLKEEGLADSIRSMIEDFELVSTLKIRFVHDLESDLLSQGKKITLFRIVQEQLKNILKHSKAVNTSILLQSRNGQLQLVIQDDGAGFDPRQTHRGIGLSNIQERVKFYNGSVSIEAAPGKGCTMTVSIPLIEE